MDFLKKNYEKVLLGVVLLGLAVAVAFLPFKIASEQQELENKRNQLAHPSVKPLPSLDLAPPEAALKLMATPAPVDFSPPNKLFNPMKWQRAVSGQLMRVDSGHIGPEALVITKLTPLYLVLTLDLVTVPETGPARYRIGVEKQAAANVRDRNKTQKFLSVGEKNETFKLEAAYGPLADNPTNVVLILNDTGEKANLSKDVPFKREDGFMADLKYPPENRTWEKRRMGPPPLTFNNEEHKIVAINKDNVIISSTSGKKTTINYTAAP